jgi:formate hydrogenlyase subunit 4
MSGVMIKLGIYGLLRVGLEWLGPGPAWWGVALLLAGTVSALKGVLYALVERDLKRLLAFSSIENVGIVLIGVGAGMVFHASGLEFLAVFAVAAGLYHTANHAAFKALLFLGAGAVTHALGTRDMEAMGGLIKRMPWTAAAFLVGAVAIAALPPLNGFVSEWLTLLALLQAAQIPRLELSLVFALAIAGLALTSGLAVACFVRAFGITFLALPRSDAAAGAHEAGRATRAALALLALACVALGLGPTVVLPVLGGAAASLVGLPAPVLVEWPLTLTVAGDFASLSVPVIALGPGPGSPPAPAGAPPRGGAAGTSVRRDLGLRAAAADGAHGVQRDVLRRAVQAHLRLRVSPTEAARDRVPSRVALLRPADVVRESSPRARGGMALRPGGPGFATCQRPDAPPPVRQLEPLPHLRARRAAHPPGARVTAAALAAVAQTLLVAAGAPLLVGLLRTLKARLAGRRGPNPWQPYFDLAKLLRKETVVSETTSWVFGVTPYVLAATMLVAAAVVPVIVTRPALAFAGNVVLLMYLFMLGTFFLASPASTPAAPSAGWGRAGASRWPRSPSPPSCSPCSRSPSAPGPSTWAAWRSASAADPVLAAHPGHLLAFLAFFIVMVAENGRLPVDNPATHLELTMIHEAMVLEYSGHYLALVEWAGAMKLFLFLTLLANLFFPWWIPSDVAALPMLLGALALAGKLVLLAAALAVIETVVAKLRLFRVPELLAGSFALAVLSVASVVLLK